MEKVLNRIGMQKWLNHDMKIAKYEYLMTGDNAQVKSAKRNMHIFHHVHAQKFHNTGENVYIPLNIPVNKWCMLDRHNHIINYVPEITFYLDD